MRDRPCIIYSMSNENCLRCRQHIITSEGLEELVEGVEEPLEAMERSFFGDEFDLFKASWADMLKQRIEQEKNCPGPGENNVCPAYGENAE